MTTKHIGMGAAALGFLLIGLAHCAGTPDDRGPSSEGPTPHPEAIKGDWECVGSVSWPPTHATTVSLDFRAARAWRYGESVLKACTKGDTFCARPLDETRLRAADDGDDDPIARLNVPTGTYGWDGYAELTGAGHPTVLAFEVPPVTRDQGVRGLPQNALFAFTDALASSVGVFLDPSRGAIAFDVADCANQPADGASVRVDLADEDTVPIYFESTFPVVGGVTEAASGAIGLLVNVPPGRATLTVTVGPAGKRIGEVQVVTRAGALTTVHLPPTRMGAPPAGELAHR